MRGDQMSLEEKVVRNFKLTPSENMQLKKDAYAHGMNVSEYIRYLIEKERKKESAR
jgi:predicted DNA binding CopG/RHH family protein